MLRYCRDSRKLLDTSEIRKCFGPVVIEYGKVQSKVMLKFDNWHKEVLNSFGKLLNEQMIGFHGEIAKVFVDRPSLNNRYYHCHHRINNIVYQRMT